MSFDPRQIGADCDSCVLNDQKACRSELRDDSLATVVIDFPSKDDVEIGKVFSGNEAVHFLKHCQSVAATRKTFSYTAALLCHPPQDDMSKLRQKLKAINKQRAKKNLPPMKDPVECCSKRLNSEMGTKVIPLGSLALEAVNGSSLPITKYRGAPLDIGGGRTAIPIFSPRMIQHQQKFTRAYRVDIRRAINYFRGKTEWVEPTLKYRPSVQEVKDFLRRNKRICHDYETERKGQIRSKVYCLGLANGTEAICIAFVSIETFQRLYSPQDEAEIRAALRDAMLDPTKEWVGHNSGVFDDVVSDGFLGCHPVERRDTIMFHRSAESELPHNLAYVGSVFTAISRAWKATNSGTEAKSDMELWEYCLMHGTRVMLADGRTLPIERIVLDKMDVEVRTLNEKTGVIENKRVIGWHQNKSPGQKWVQIKTCVTLPSEKGLIATPEHSVFTDRGWLEAKDVKVGDGLYIDEIEFTVQQKQALLGTLLGDSILTVSPSRRADIANSDSYSLMGGHRLSDNLAQMKVKEISSHLDLGKVKAGFHVEVNGRHGDSQPFQTFTSPALYQLKELYQLIYDENNKRRFKPEVIDLLGPIGWAWMFMDDGCNQARNFSKTGDGTRIGRETNVIALQGFPTEDVEMASKWLTSNFGPVSHAKDNTIRFSADAAEKFCTWIAPHVFESQRYKLVQHLDYPAYQPFEPSKWNPICATVTEVNAFVPPRNNNTDNYRADYRWCIDVEDNHNFFTSVGLVHNCMLDCIVCFRCLEPLAQVVIGNGQAHIVQLDHKLQDVAKGMHVNGMLVDKKRRNEHDLRLKKEIAVNKRILFDALGTDKFNPASAVQVRDLIYDDWQLPVLIKSKKTGMPSTSSKAIIQLLLEGQVDPKQKIILNSLRKVRRAGALRGTRIARLRTPDEKYVTAFDPDHVFDMEDEEDEDFEAEESKYRKKDEDKEPLLHEDGRLHASWLPHAPVTGRFSAQLVMNWPRDMRDLFIAGLGNVLIALDADQGELRVSTNLSKAKFYTEAFLQGLDPHTINAKLVFGEEGKPFYEKACRDTAAAWLAEQNIVLSGSKLDKQARKDDETWSGMATFAKIFVFSAQYKAQIETIFTTLRMYEDKKGGLPYAGLKMGTAVERYNNWIGSVPEFKTWWQTDLDEYRNTGFIEEPITGRRRFFLEGEDENEIANFKCQCVDYNTLILTEEGYIKIGELAKRTAPFEAWTGKRVASAVAFQKGEAEIFKVTTSRGNTIFVDKTHKFLVVGEKELEWTTTENVMGKRIALQIAEPLTHGTPNMFTEEDMYWLGLWYADGSSTWNSNVEIRLSWCISDGKGLNNCRGGQKTVDDLMYYLKNNGNPRPWVYQGVGCVSVCSSTGGLEWLTKFGVSTEEKAHTKRIPQSVWLASLEQRKAFIRGFLDGDGYWDINTNHVQVQLCQREILEDLWLLCRSVGIHGGTIIGPYEVDREGHIAYRLNLSGKHVWQQLAWGQAGAKIRSNETVPLYMLPQFMDQLKPQTASQQTLYRRIVTGGTTSPYSLMEMGAEWMYDFADVISVESTGETRPVYTLSVDDPDHQYCANGFISKNSGLAGIMNRGVLKFLEQVPFNGKYGPGLINQVHDSLVVEVKEEYAEEVLRIMKECLTYKHPTHVVPYTFSGKVGIKYKMVDGKKVKDDALSRWSYTE